MYSNRNKLLLKRKRKILIPLHPQSHKIILQPPMLKKTASKSGPKKDIKTTYYGLSQNRMLDVSDYLNGKYSTMNYLKTDKSAKKHIEGLAIASDNPEAFEKALQDLEIKDIKQK